MNYSSRFGGSGTIHSVQGELNIERPTLLLNKERAIRNIESMARKARTSGVRFRPHFKTHQSAQIGEWFKQFDVKSITVSSVDMATYFSANGWKDITIAFPANVRAIGRMNELAEKINLGLLVESKETIDFLRGNLKSNVKVWINIDVGYKRTGVLWSNTCEVMELAERIKHSKTLSFAGILTHAGHSYNAKSTDEIREIYFDSLFKMRKLRDGLRAKGFSNVEISVGDTPTCSLVRDFSGVDEVRPGTFVFYDVMQMTLGSCSEQDIAIALACPVVAKHKERNEIVIHGGAGHLSKDFISKRKGIKIFGYVTTPQKYGWGPLVSNTYVSSLSQEHGIIKTDDDFFRRVQVGDLLLALPVHCCLTVDLMREFLTLKGDIVQTMPKFC